MQLKNAIFKKKSVVILLLLMCSGSIGYYINSYINKKWYNQDMLTANQIASFITVKSGLKVLIRPALKCSAGEPNLTLI